MRHLYVLCLPITRLLFQRPLRLSKPASDDWIETSIQEFERELDSRLG